MSCLICAGPAERVVCSGNWEERKCGECGHYRIPDSLVLALMDQGQIFDIPKARAYLMSQRAASMVPSIDSVDGLLHP
ncbi:hypothetical protein ACI2KS_12355 [Pseudomonas sp. NPDC087358]|jgi:hypothetical protein|uniref:hypothetical protein n=1 Tax=Pseudomonas sp. NPDC087358 TaxID=3364439 RepID=UPI00384C8BB5